MARAVVIPAYALGGLLIFMGFIASLIVILSIPSPFLTITGYLSANATLYMGLGENVLVIIGGNEFNAPLKAVNIVIPRSGTNITLTGNIPSTLGFLAIVIQYYNGTTEVYAPGLQVMGNVGNLSKLMISQYQYAMNATAYVENVKRSYTLYLTTAHSGIVLTIPYITNTSRPILTITTIQAIPFGETVINGFGFMEGTSQGIYMVKCNLTSPLPITTTPTTLTLNMSSVNGTLNPTGIRYRCNSTPIFTPSMLYMNFYINYTYTYGPIQITRVSQYPLQIIPMQAAQDN
ncbi:hypothetical protein [Vulcanisaeta thermophila]|uniref:hypothetical protein n=1 Tax=Vulcanisaeta thermophila TaxID=867917 RepID=UPI000852D006|nr:hypothetical protein [Vulcanisaeta thermophila]